MGDTSIRVSEELAEELHDRKNRGDSYEDVIWRLLEQREPQTGAQEPPAPPETTDDLPEGLDLPGSGETLQRRRETVARLYDHLKQEETASKSDFLELVDPDYVELSTRESFWSNCIKGRDSLRSLPGVDAPGEGEHTWRYRG